MTPVVTSSGGGSGGGTAPARNMRGRAVVPSGATVTLVSFVAGSIKCRGFHVAGDGDAFVWIEADGDAIDGMAARHSIVKDAYRVLPNPESYPSPTSLITLRCNNLGGTVEFEGVIFGE
jgi:hypothetical protein